MFSHRFSHTHDYLYSYHRIWFKKIFLHFLKFFLFNCKMSLSHIFIAFLMIKKKCYKRPHTITVSLESVSPTYMKPALSLTFDIFYRILSTKGSHFVPYTESHDKNAYKDFLLLQGILLIVNSKIVDNLFTFQVVCFVQQSLEDYQGQVITDKVSF